MPNCRFPTCQKIKLKGFGLCNKHYLWVKNGYMTQDLKILKVVSERNVYSGEKCRIKDCDRKARSKFFCSNHYIYIVKGLMTEDGKKLKPAKKYKKDFGCIVCGKTGKIIKDFCRKHYAQYRKGILNRDGEELKEIRTVLGPFIKCLAEDCQRKAAYHGWCKNHLRSFERGIYNGNGKRLKNKYIQNKDRNCKELNCNRPAKTRGLCRLHYSRILNGYLGTKGRKNKGQNCSESNCNRPAHCRTLCHLHYRQLLTKEKKENELRKSLSQGQNIALSCEGINSNSSRIEISNSKKEVSNT